MVRLPLHHAREEADICFTSPPYAQQRDYKTGPQDWDALMQGVFSILPVKHGAQVLVNLRGVGASVLVNLRGVGASFTSAGVMNP